MSPLTYALLALHSACFVVTLGLLRTIAWIGWCTWRRCEPPRSASEIVQLGRADPLWTNVLTAAVIAYGAPVHLFALSRFSGLLASGSVVETCVLTTKLAVLVAYWALLWRHRWHWVGVLRALSATAPGSRSDGG